MPRKTMARLAAATASIPEASCGEGKTSSSAMNSAIATPAVIRPPVRSNQ
jgi:hypothetical protein